MNKVRTMSPGELARLIKEGLEVNLLLESHTLKELKRVRKSKVLLVEGDRLILAWPQPSLPRPVLGTQLEVSFVIPLEGEMQRYGYTTRVNETLFGYTTADAQTHQAVVVDLPLPADLSPSTLRLFLRTNVPPELGLKVKVVGLGSHELLDLSSKGLSLALPLGETPPAKGTPLSLTVEGFDEHLELSGKVVGLVEHEDKIQVSVELFTMPVTNALALKMLIRQIESASRRTKGE